MLDTPEDRRQANLKVIEPLFLDDLRAEFARLKGRRDSRAVPELHRFQQKLGRLRLFDPACGCGNFLIIAYRVDQFHGIEIGEFAARIASTALWKMDQIMNSRLSLEFGLTCMRIPIERSPNVRHADALEIDWAEVLPPAECSYVFGNPPFGGSKYQSTEQRAQVRRIAAQLAGAAAAIGFFRWLDPP